MPPGASHLFLKFQMLLVNKGIVEVIEFLYKYRQRHFAVYKHVVSG
jgi:hypothetical protein